MKKEFKSFIMGLVAVVSCLGFVACSNDDNNQSVSLKGKRYSISKNLNEFMIIKEELANMFAGYAIMLAEGGLAPQPDAAALEAFKKSFVDAFVYYNVTLRLRKI